MPALAFLLVLLIALPAVAEVMVCGQRADIVKRLGNAYNERLEELGLTNRGHMMELFISAQDDTWTLILTNPRGFSCVMEEGEGWQRAPDALRERIDERKL